MFEGKATYLWVADSRIHIHNSPMSVREVEGGLFMFEFLEDSVESDSDSRIAAFLADQAGGKVRDEDHRKVDIPAGTTFYVHPSHIKVMR